MHFLKKPFVYALIFSLILISCSSYVLLDTFVIPHTISAAVSEEDHSVTGKRKAAGATAGDESGTTQEKEQEDAGQDAVITDTSYKDDNISITLKTIEAYDTTVYIADVELSSAEYLKTALAQDSYGTNITETTSSQAESHQAILAVNGDYYGADKSGYVIKNGQIYRNSVRLDSEYDDLVVYEDGTFGIINEEEVSAEELTEEGVTQLFAFGPSLVEDGNITVSQKDEVGKAMASNPRTAIGVIGDLHYLFVVADGRTSESEGLSLYELAQIMQKYGCITAYNLDGGGSSTLYFNGQVMNKPTTNGHSFGERGVSDIVYIGYKN